jgi:glucose uptake protein
MFVPQSFIVALVMVIFSTICWGSWANTFKGVRNYRYELFYWDYAVGVVVISLALGFTMGSARPDATSFLANLHSADGRNILAALVGGAVYSLGALLLVAGIERTGLAVAFPVAIGIGLVVGVVLSYGLDPRGNPLLLALGVGLALVAVMLDSKAHRERGRPGRRFARKSVGVLIFSGVMIGLGPPFIAYAMTAGRRLEPYGTAFFFTVGILLASLACNGYLMRKPLSGEPIDAREYFRASARNHFLGIAGGCISGAGIVFNLVAAHFTGVAISYAIGQAAPMVAALWGVFAWHEFRGSSGRAKSYLALMFLFYLLAIATVAAAKRAA